MIFIFSFFKRRQNNPPRIQKVISEANTYWIKDFSVREKKDIFKPNSQTAIQREILMLKRLSQAGIRVPKVVGHTDHQLMLTDIGTTLNRILPYTSRRPRMQIIALAAKAIADLHAKQLFHGRPAIRDLTYDGQTVGFLDFENADQNRPIDKAQVRDLFFFIQSLYREKYLDDHDAAHALSTYRHANHTAHQVAERLTAKIQTHRRFQYLIEHLPIHGKDVVATRKTFVLFTNP